MSDAIRHFLLVFDHSQGKLLEELDFGTDIDKAMAEYAHRERAHMSRGDVIEIVLIGSDSIETVKRTHANYFDGTLTNSRYLAGI